MYTQLPRFASIWRGFPPQPWDSEAAQQYAQVLAALERGGEPMGNLDMMIVAQALAVQAVLVTNDRAFRKIKQLKIEDWSGPRP